MIELPKNTTPLVIIGDVVEALKRLPPKSINVAVTSPPYWGQRDYRIKGQIGKERTSEEYVQKMIEIGKELRRVLTNDGSYFLNIGDKYKKKNLEMIPFRVAFGMQQNGWTIRNVIIWNKTNPMPSSIKDRFNVVYEPIIFFVKSTGKYYTRDYYFDLDSVRKKHKTKNKNGFSELPETLSTEDYKNWRNKIVHNNYNGKFKGVKSVNFGASPGARMSTLEKYYSLQRKHKITKTMETEIIKYLKEAWKKKGISIKEIDKMFGYRHTAGHWFRLDPGRSMPKPEDWDKLQDILNLDDRYDKIMKEQHYVLQVLKYHKNGKNPGDVWSFPTANIQEAHFAVFPDELPRRVIKACCPKDGVVLDPFGGSGTTSKVAMELGRKSIMIELNPKYLKIMRKRCGNIVVYDLNTGEYERTGLDKFIQS